MMASGIKDGDRIVDLILSKGADVNATTNNGQTALHLASSKDNVDVVTKLVDRGANVAVKDKRNQKALHRAAAGGCEPIVRILLKGQGKASVDAMDSDGLSALHHGRSCRCYLINDETSQTDDTKQSQRDMERRL